MEKLIEMSKAFDVSIDYLLKPSELDELSVKTRNRDFRVGEK